MHTLVRTVLIWIALLAASGLQAAPPLAPATADRNVTFISTSDSHYAAFVNEYRNERNRATLGKLGPQHQQPSPSPDDCCRRAWR